MAFLTIDSPIRWLFLFHAVLGATALVFFAVPLLSKKGGKLHVRTGWVYVAAMVMVGVTAFLMTPWRIFGDSSATISSINFSLFLFYIALFTLSAIWYGLRALKNKQRKFPERSWIVLFPPIATVIIGVLIQIVGFKHQNTLLMAFPFLGHVTSKKQLQYWLQAPREKMHWWYAHMDGMVIACIATITAFLVTAAPKIWPGPFTSSPILWIAPGIIFGTILNRWTANAKRKFEK